MSESAIKRIGDFGKNFASKSLETVLLTEIGDTLRDHFDTTEVDKERLRIFLAEKLAASDASFFTEPLLGFADAVFNWASDVLEEPQ